MYRIISRPVPDKLPELPMPLYVRSAGYNDASRGWAEFFPGAAKEFVQIFWCVEGEGEFIIGRNKYSLRKDQFFYQLPGENHEHYCISDRWAYHWCTFDGNLASAFIQGYGFPRRGLDAGPCPSGLFLRIESLMKEMTPFSQMQMLSVAADLLSRIGHVSAGDFPDGVAGRFLELAQRNYTNETVNVNSLAELIGVHRTTLNRLFKRQMNMSPCDYLMRLRVQRALSLLRETDLPVCEVGALAGIPHRGYFCSLIRKMTGVSPAVYRERRMM